jgi:hypothetical protein
MSAKRSSRVPPSLAGFAFRSHRSLSRLAPRYSTPPAHAHRFLPAKNAYVTPRLASCTSNPLRTCRDVARHWLLCFAPSSAKSRGTLSSSLCAETNHHTRNPHLKGQQPDVISASSSEWAVPVDVCDVVVVGSAGEAGDRAKGMCSSGRKYPQRTTIFMHGCSIMDIDSAGCTGIPGSLARKCGHRGIWIRICRRRRKHSGREKCSTGVGGGE